MVVLVLLIPSLSSCGGASSISAVVVAGERERGRRDCACGDGVGKGRR